MAKTVDGCLVFEKNDLVQISDDISDTNEVEFLNSLTGKKLIVVDVEDNDGLNVYACALAETPNEPIKHPTIDGNPSFGFVTADLVPYKEIDRVIRVHEIHGGDDDDIYIDFDADTIYTTMDDDVTIMILKKGDVQELESGNKSISLDVSVPNTISIMEFIKHLSCDFSNAFILLSPNEEQDIIVDFTLNTDTYFKIIDKKF